MSIIAHIDMDAFFASVEERDKPWLRGLPIVVGADPEGGKGRGVVSTANYVARTYGIKSALPIRKAWEYSERARRDNKPAVAFITPTSNRYGLVSKQVFKIVERYTPHIERTSIDEGYFDLTKEKTFKQAKVVSKNIKQAIQKELQLSASIGIGSNRMIAKIASNFNKPNGLTVVKPEGVVSFLDPQSVRVLPGVGPKLAGKLAACGVRYIHELRHLSEEKLNNLAGSWGQALYKKARGEGSDQLLEPDARIPKSIGQHKTFREDTHDMHLIFSVFEKMAEKIVKRMQEKHFESFRTTVVTIRFDNFETKTRSVTTVTPLVSEKELLIKAIKLSLPFFSRTENPHNKCVRLVGLRIEKLTPCVAE